MLRTVLLTALALAIAIGGGAASVWYALTAQQGIGALTIGAWTAHPDLGGPAADPYARARAARDGVLFLGNSEGVVFTANRDSAGELIRRQCLYNVVGSVPTARLWTMHAVDGALEQIQPALPHAAALHSRAALRLAGGDVSAVFSPLPQPGNWIATSGRGEMTIMLTLYDTPLLGGAGVADVVLPQVIRGGCDG